MVECLSGGGWLELVRGEALHTSCTPHYTTAYQCTHNHTIPHHTTRKYSTYTNFTHTTHHTIVRRVSTCAAPIISLRATSRLALCDSSSFPERAIRLYASCTYQTNSIYRCNTKHGSHGKRDIHICNPISTYLPHGRKKGRSPLVLSVMHHCKQGIAQPNKSTQTRLTSSAVAVACSSNRPCSLAVSSTCTENKLSLASRAEL